MSRKKKILIVEDEAPVAIIIRFLLNQAGCDTQIATSIPKALQLAREYDFDLITMDVGMPDGDGVSLYGQLRQDARLKETPIIFVPGRASLEDQQRGLELGAADYITKPFQTFEFAPCVLSHIKMKNPIT